MPADSRVDRSFVLVDQSSPAMAGPERGGQLLPALLAQMAAAFEEQLNLHVARHYGGAYLVRAGDSTADVQATEDVYAIVDTFANTAPGAIAFHDVDGGARPYGLGARDQCMSILDGTSSMAMSASHELIEIVLNPSVNLYADDIAGFSYAREGSDPTEVNGYTIDGVTVSDFVLPSYWEPGAPGPYTYMQLLGMPGAYPVAPLTPGGNSYQVRRARGTGETDVWGSMRPQKATKNSHWSSRVFRLGARF